MSLEVVPAQNKWICDFCKTETTIDRQGVPVGWSKMQTQKEATKITYLYVHRDICDVCTNKLVEFLS